jgi:hypothetical protein
MLRKSQRRRRTHCCCPVHDAVARTVRGQVQPPAEGAHATASCEGYHAGDEMPEFVVADIACLGFDKSIILSYSSYKLVIPTDRGQCPDASVG